MIRLFQITILCFLIACKNDLTPESDRGMVEPFDRPGLGLDIDEAALVAWRITA